MPSFPSGTWSSSLLEHAIAVYSPHPTEQPVTSAAFGRLVRHLLEDGLRLLPASGSGGEITGVEILSAGMRSVVLRLGLRDFAEPSVVLKYFRRKDSATNSGGFGYLREKHGLSALEQVAPGLYPRLLASDNTARLLILEDVTSSNPTVSLGDLLLSTGADAAPHRGLTAWVDTWASILRSPAQAAAQVSFSAELASADTRASAPGSLPSPQLAFRGLHLLAKRQGVAVESAEFARMEQAVASIIYPVPSERVLSSGDFSPANLLPQAAPASGVRGIDAEGTCWHHWALPVAELLLGFPSWPEGPLPLALVASPTWQTKTQDFYQRIAPCPQATLDRDKQVAAATLTIQAILAEQATGQDRSQ